MSPSTGKLYSVAVSLLFALSWSAADHSCVSSLCSCSPVMFDFSIVKLTKSGNGKVFIKPLKKNIGL
mgnify:CR=1 FL=1